MTAEDYALQKQREAGSGYDFTTNDIEEAFNAGMQEMMQQHQEDEIWIECTSEENNFWKAFWKYINDEAIGDKLSIIDAVVNNEHNWFEGYVKVKKVINDKQKLLIKFTNNKGNEYTAEWQPADNYAVWQTCGMACDDFSGYLLFPTYRDDEYFCIYYNC